MNRYRSKSHSCLNLIAVELARLDKPETWRIARIYDLIDQYYEVEAKRFYVKSKPKKGFQRRGVISEKDNSGCEPS